MRDLSYLDTHVLVTLVTHWLKQDGADKGWPTEIGTMKLRLSPRNRDEPGGFDLRDYWFMEDRVLTQEDRGHLRKTMRDIQPHLSGWDFPFKAPIDEFAFGHILSTSQAVVDGALTDIQPKLETIHVMLAECLKPLAQEIYCRPKERLMLAAMPIVVVADLLIWPYGKRRWTYAIEGQAGDGSAYDAMKVQVVPYE